jgi:hypothetical protein
MRRAGGAGGAGAGGRGRALAAASPLEGGGGAGRCWRWWARAGRSAAAPSADGAGQRAEPPLGLREALTAMQASAGPAGALGLGLCAGLAMGIAAPALAAPGRRG